MPTPDEIATAVKVIKEASGDPSTGAIKELLDILTAPVKVAKNSGDATKEARILSGDETR